MRVGFVVMSVVVNSFEVTTVLVDVVGAGRRICNARRVLSFLFCFFGDDDSVVVENEREEVETISVSF